MPAPLTPPPLPPIRACRGTKQVTRAAAEFYGPNRAQFLGPFTSAPSYLKGEFPGERPSVAWG